MSAFKTNTGQTLVIDITMDAVKRVKAALGVSLPDLTEGAPPLITRLEVDIELQVDVVYWLVKPALDAASISPEAFAASLGGRAIADLHDALMEALVDFFRMLRRPQMAAAVLKQMDVVKAAQSRQQAMLDKLDVEEIVTLAQSGSTASPSSLPPSQAATLDPGR